MDALEWNDLAVLLAVCRTGTLSGAARSLGVNHTTVFRKVNAIEERTGVRFFDRLPSGYRMTEAGETALRYAERIESEVHALGREVLGRDMQVRGHVRVTAPDGLTTLVLPRAMAAFSRQHPDVSFEIVGTASALDLSKREAEVAIRATRKPPEASFGRKVCGFNFGIYGAPDYLAERRDLPLESHPWCLLSGVVGWMVPSVFARAKDIEGQVLLTSPSILATVNAAAEGMGLTMLPFYIGEPEPRLERLGGPVPGLSLQLWLLTHPDLRHTARVRLLMDHLYAFLLERRAIFEGE